MGEKTAFNTMRLKGRVESVGGNSITLLETDSNKDALLCSGTTAPTDASTGFAKGCIFILTNAATGVRGLYNNIGTNTSCLFRPIDALQSIQGSLGTIATTSTTDEYIIVPEAGVLDSVDFSGIDALAANDTNYITFSITNLGQAGAGATAMLAATDANTTKATGGTALAANTKRSLTVHGTAANLVVAAGDRLRVRATATGTLANTVTGARALLRFKATA